MSAVVRVLLWLVVSLTGVAVVAAAVVGLGIRTRHAGFVPRFTRFQRTVVNPKVLASAGTRGDPHAVVRHVGRRSGRTYETPVTPAVLPGAILLALPYGRGADWARNVLAAGRAELLLDGELLTVGEPRLVPLDDYQDRFGVLDRIAHRVFGVREGLLLTPQAPSGR